jgi:hypothetical protein
MAGQGSPPARSPTSATPLAPVVHPRPDRHGDPAERQRYEHPAEGVEEPQSLVVGDVLLGLRGQNVSQQEVGGSSDAGANELLSDFRAPRDSRQRRNR